MQEIKARRYRSPLLISAVAMLSMLLMSCGGGSQSNNSVNDQTNPALGNNTVPIVAGANSAGGPNGLFTSVTVCTPSVLPVGQNPIYGPPPAPTCQTISNILVDTNSVGLRLIHTPTVDSLGLPFVTDSNNNPLHECVQFADLSYVWGRVARATIQMAGEEAAQVPLPYETAGTGIPIQVIYSNLDTGIAVPADCLSSPPSGGAPVAANSLETLGGAGILGVGTLPQDCGAACASTPPPNQYYFCPSGLCTVASIGQNVQVWNPVAAFPDDNNGLSLSLFNLPAPGGSTSINGSMTFGIGTQSDNALNELVTVYGIDSYGNFAEVTLIEPNLIDPSLPPTIYVSYLSPQNGSYIDSGSPAIYFSDWQSLGVPECPEDSGQPRALYCPTAMTGYSANLYGANTAKGTFGWNIGNADKLLNSGNSVFNNLGGDSGINISTDYVDLGLPFFFGHTVYVGFAGISTAYPQPAATYPNGYWAF